MNGKEKMSALVEIVARTMMETVGVGWDDMESKREACIVSKAAIQSIQEAGYCIVPQEVDESMKAEFYNALAAWKNHSGKVTTNVASDIYKAFIKAAPDVLGDEK